MTSGSNRNNGKGSAKPSSGRPWWRSAVDNADRLVTPAANSFVRTDLFADLVSTVTRVEARVRRRIERQATWYWHQFHLPSAGDVRRVSAQLAAIEARVRDVSERLDDHEAASAERAEREAPAKTSAKAPAKTRSKAPSKTR